VNKRGSAEGQKMIRQKKREIREKYLKMPPNWITGTIRRELNLPFTNDTWHESAETALQYWRQNRKKFPPPCVWEVLRRDLDYKSFGTRKELWSWCVARVKQLKDPVYIEEERKKKEEEERLAWEAEQERRRNDPNTWEYHIAKAEVKNRRMKEPGTSKTWPPPSPERGILRLLYFSPYLIVVSVDIICKYDFFYFSSR